MTKRNVQLLDQSVELIGKQIIGRRKEKNTNPMKTIIINKRATGLMIMRVTKITD